MSSTTSPRHAGPHRQPEPRSATGRIPRSSPRVTSRLRRTASGASTTHHRVEAVLHAVLHQQRHVVDDHVALGGALHQLGGAPAHQGCTMALRSARAAGSANTTRPSPGRSSDPSAVSTPVRSGAPPQPTPRCRAPPPPGPARQRRSPPHPRPASRAATVLLPLPMPPVRPMRTSGRSARRRRRSRRRRR